MTDTEQINRSNNGAPPLVRPQANRVLAGVAAGLAHRLSVPTWLVRLVFVLLTLSGGVGMLAYLAGWLLIPAEGQAQPAAGQLLGRIEGPRAWIGVGLVVLAVFVAVESTGLIDADLAVAAVLILVGVLLYRGDLGTGGSNEEDSQTMTTHDSSGVTSTIDLDTQAGDAPADPPAPPPQPPTPAATPPPPVAPVPRERSILGRLTIAIGLIVLGILGMFDTIGGYDISARHYFGTAMAIVGLGLLVGSFVGRARGLIVLGVILLPPLLASPIGDFDFRDDSARYSPQTVGAIQDAYVADVGELEIDLSNVDFAGADVAFDAEVRFGQLTIVVPDDVAVDAMASVAVGQVEVFNTIQSGIGEVETRRQIEGDNGTLTIDARADAGQIEIVVEDQRSTPSSELNSRSDFGIRAGDLDYQPSTSSDLQESYNVGAGELVLDLSELSLETPRRVTANVDLGDLTVILPEDVDAEVFASVGLGDIDTPGGDVSGVDRTANYQSGPDPLLTLDLHVGAGAITVEDLR